MVSWFAHWCRNHPGPLSKLNNAIIPLPPLAEQSRIVAEVDELIQVCDALAEKLIASRQLTQQLMKTLTEKSCVIGE